MNFVLNEIAAVNIKANYFFHAEGRRPIHLQNNGIDNFWLGFDSLLNFHSQKKSVWQRHLSDTIVIATTSV